MTEIATPATPTSDPAVDPVVTDTPADSGEPTYDQLRAELADAQAQLAAAAQTNTPQSPVEVTPVAQPAAADPEPEPEPEQTEADIHPGNFLNDDNELVITTRIRVQAYNARPDVTEPSSRQGEAPTVIAAFRSATGHNPDDDES